MHVLFTEYRAGHQCRKPSHIAESRGVQRVDAGQFRDPSSAGQGTNVVHPPQDQLTIDGVGVMEGPGSCVTKLLSAIGEVLHYLKLHFI